MLDQTKIGAFIAERRRAAGLSQAQLAEKLGVSNRTVSRWENGQNMPDYAVLPPLLEILGVSANELLAGERIAEKPAAPQYDANILAMAEAYQRMKKRLRIFLVIGLAVLMQIVQLLILFGLLYYAFVTAKVEVTIDPAAYADVIGPNAKDIYRSKWGMDESIFPSAPDPAQIEAFQMAYYDPWDAQYIAYLVMDYDEASYAAECERLASLPMTDYKGYYGASGFTRYTLLAMFADSYNGFVYALTDGEGRIIYAELIFCNYCLDLDYRQYIPPAYLPDGFDATPNNPYRKAQRAAH